MQFLRFSATPVPEGGAAKSAGVPTQLMGLFCFFSFIISFQQHMKASGMMRDCFRWFRFLGLSTSRSGLSPAFSGTGKGSYKL